MHQKDCEQNLLGDQARHDPEEGIVVHGLVFGAWPTLAEFNAKHSFELAWQMEQKVISDEGKWYDPKKELRYLFIYVICLF